MVNFAQFGSVKKGIEESIKPQFNNRALIGPEPFKRFHIIKSETNGGTAIVMTKIVRQNALYFKPFVLISKAKMIPKKKQVAVAKTAQIKVQPSTGKNVEAISPVITLPRFANPTQVKRFFGGKWLWS